MQLALNDGAYQARSIIASAQRCVNLYPEVNQLNRIMMLPQQISTSLLTHYPTPGLTLLATLGAGPVRGLYRGNNGVLYAASGATVYAITAQWKATVLGQIDGGTTPVSMADNGQTLVIVDGTANGYTVDMATGAFAQISDPAFYGADKVDYIDTFFVFNKPGTPQFYSTTSGVVTPFDGNYFADKVGYGDTLQTLVVMHRELWLIGQVSTEVWYDAGGSTFPFALVPGAFIQHGTAAKYSVAQQDVNLFWLSEDLQGQRMVLMGLGYAAQRISTHAIEQEFSKYAVVSDAIGFTYQQQGHVFYVLTFPSADRTWVYDVQSQLWHERAWLDAQGVEHRHRAMSCAFAHGTNVCGDWQNGNLYSFDQANYTDNGAATRRIRSFPATVNELNRVMFRKFIADMQVGSDTANLPAEQLQVALRWSDTRGASWGNPVYQSLGAGGAFATNMQWRRLGMSRARVFELSWSGAVNTALNGAYIDVEAASS